MTYTPEMVYYMGGHAPLNVIVIWDEALLDQARTNIAHLATSVHQSIFQMKSGSGWQGAEVGAADSEEGGADRGGEHQGAAGGGHVGAATGRVIQDQFVDQRSRIKIFNKIVCRPYSQQTSSVYKSSPAICSSANGLRADNCADQRSRSCPTLSAGHGEGGARRRAGPGRGGAVRQRGLRARLHLGHHGKAQGRHGVAGQGCQKCAKFSRITINNFRRTSPTWCAAESSTMSSRRVSTSELL